MTQLEKLLTVLKDGRVHTVPELIKKVYEMDKPSSARLAARIYDLKQKGYKINSDALTPTKWWYQLEVEKSHVWKNRGKHTSKVKA